jgi:tetratricopeptide (TPR) repeat protein
MIGACSRGRIVMVTLILSVAVATARLSADTVPLARHQFEAGRYVEAVDTLTVAVTNAPNDPAAFFWLGRAQFELRDYGSAIRAFERGVELAPNDSEMHRWLGRAYGEAADRQRSFTLAVRVRKQFEAAVRLVATNIAARRDLLQFFLEAPRILGGGDEKARREVEEIAAVDPIAGHLARAAYLRHQDEASQADAEYRAVLRSKPATVEPTIEAAEFYERQRNVEGLRSAVEAAAGIEPSDPRLSYFRGVLNIISGGNPSQGEAWLTAYLAVPPRSDRPSAASAHEWLGRLFEQAGSSSRAVDHYRAALALEPGRKSAKASLRRLGQP